jgi:hypothetical protein
MPCLATQAVSQGGVRRCGIAASSWLRWWYGNGEMLQQTGSERTVSGAGTGSWLGIQP